MTLQVSTGFKKMILGPYSFEGIFSGGAIALYTGAQPDTADSAATGTLLGYVSTDGLTWTPGSVVNGLTWQRTDAFCHKPSADIWAVTPVATGTAGWFRILPATGDIALVSYEVPRIDGAVSSTSGELRLLSPSLTISTIKYIEQFFYTIPPLPGA